MRWRAIWVFVAYAVIAATLLFIACAVWFALLWGINPVAIFPLYIVGFWICGVCIVVARTLRNSN